MTGATVEDRPSTRRRGLFSSPTRPTRAVSDSNLSSTARQMVDALTEDEKEHAARASFKYLWHVARGGSTADRDHYATAMAMRHLSSKKGNYTVALQTFKHAIEFRRAYDLDGLRLCFYSDKLVLDAETRKRYAEYRQRLEERMTSARVYVQGYDKQGRAIYTIYASRTKDFDSEWFLKESLYNFERAIACTERQSGGAEDKIMVIGNYNGFQSKHAAPLSVSHEFMDCLRQNYPGRVKRVNLLNTPTTFLLFWSILKPFIGTDTRKKIQFINSERQREREFSGLVSKDQAAPWMLDGGKKRRDLDVVEYLYNTPFDHAFDDNHV